MEGKRNVREENGSHYIQMSEKEVKEERHIREGWKRRREEKEFEGG